MRRAAAAACFALACGAALAGGCGGSDPGKRLDVAAAASLTGPVTAYAKEFGHEHHVDVRVRFGGSDELAAQIREGVPTDAFLSADRRQPALLAHAGELERPVPFTSNRLVVAADPRGPVHALADLAKRGTLVVLGSPAVPVGEYAREVIARLPGTERRGLLANVRSSEPDVKSVLAKVSTGAADAGIVYATDARAAGGQVRTVDVPAALQPRIRYDAGVTRSSGSKTLARQFIDGLRNGQGEAKLRAAGFAPLR